MSIAQLNLISMYGNRSVKVSSPPTHTELLAKDATNTSTEPAVSDDTNTDSAAASAHSRSALSLIRVSSVDMI